MTLTMADSTTAADLPVGCDAYAAYTDGKYANLGAVRARFYNSRIVAITVTGADLTADCVDRETYDASAATAAKWAKAKIAAGYYRPIVYASQTAMAAVIAALAAVGVPRAQVRLWTAHYGWPQHICSPTACWLPDHSALPYTADGTQWADTGPNGEHYDRSILADDFFSITPQEDDMARLIQGKGDSHWYSTDGVTRTYMPSPAVVADLVAAGALNAATPTVVSAATVAALPLNPLSPTPAPSPSPAPNLAGLVIQFPPVTGTITEASA